MKPLYTMEAVAAILAKRLADAPNGLIGQAKTIDGVEIIRFVKLEDANLPWPKHLPTEQ